MDYETAAEAIRAKGQKVTPYRVGQEMGRAHRAIFEAWRDAAKASRDYSGRPVPPECPYVVNISVRGWRAGYDWVMKNPRP